MDAYAVGSIFSRSSDIFSFIQSYWFHEIAYMFILFSRYDDDAEIKDSDDDGDKPKESNIDDPFKDTEASPKEQEEGEEEDPVQETRIDVEVPKISTNLGNDLHFVKLPNFLSIESRPFDAKDYEEEIEDDDTLDEEGRARLKLKIENTIRWRIGYDEEGHTKRESNAKMVRWSDGSYSLHLGSEIFDVSKQTLQQTKGKKKKYYV